MKSVILLGGEPPSIELTKKICLEAETIIAADSGYHAIQDTNLKPHFLVGDFDSIKEPVSTNDFKVIYAPETNATDFEKSLRYIPDGCTELAILGGTGLRSDHFLTNLLIAASLPGHLRVIFHDNLQTISRITPSCTIEQTIPINTTVSLIPFTECDGVTTQGLKWNLTNSPMSAQTPRGQSNLAVSRKIRISLTRGILFLIINTPFE